MNELNKKEMLTLFSYIATAQLPLIKCPDDLKDDEDYPDFEKDLRAIESFAQTLTWACCEERTLDEMKHLYESYMEFSSALRWERMPSDTVKSWKGCIKAILLYRFSLIMFNAIQENLEDFQCISGQYHMGVYRPWVLAYSLELRSEEPEENT